MNKTALKLKNLGDWTSALTLIAAIPYEKETMALFPPEWTPYVIKAGIISTLALRFLGRRLNNSEAQPTAE